MKKIIWSVLLSGYVFISHAQTADEIINAYYEATGGKMLWNKLQSVKMTGHYVMGPGALAPTAVYQSKEIAYTNFSWNGMSSKTARKGNTGWTYSPWSGKRIADPMTADQIKTNKLDSDVQGLFYDYAAKGNQLEYLGTEDFDGTDVDKIRLTTKEGDMVYYYFDRESHYLLKIYKRIKLSDKEVKETMNYSDFKKTNYGIILPFAFNWVNDEGEEGGLTQFNIIEVNATADITNLEMPK